MSHHCDAEPRTVGELIIALSALDPTLPVHESWDGGPGWFEVEQSTNDASPGGYVVIGVHAPCTRDDNPDQITLEQVEADIANGRKIKPGKRAIWFAASTGKFSPSESRSIYDNPASYGLVQTGPWSTCKMMDAVANLFDYPGGGRALDEAVSKGQVEDWDGYERWKASR